MTDRECSGWGRKALPWLCLLVVQVGVARGVEGWAERLPFTSFQAATPLAQQDTCVDMGLRVDMNVLVSMTTEELDYLQAMLCPSRPT